MAELFFCVLTQSGPKPAGQGNYPITIVQVSGDSAECQVFGKQIDIMTASLRPIPAGHDWPLYGDEYSGIKFGNGPNDYQM